jgi:putative phosphoribosyl transferase
MTVFLDRTDAGRRLAERLTRFREQRPVVLALPRGGVPVAFEIARALDVPLDVVLVRKIGAPSQPELAVAAVVDGAQPETVLNREVMEALGVDERYIAEERTRQLAEIERRRALYVAGRPRPAIAGHIVILVDDGIATGATVRAALHAIRRAHPRRLVLAVPVAPPDTVESLKADADEVICLSTPAFFSAISIHYADFTQTTDEEVIALLEMAAERGTVGSSPAGTAPSRERSH